MVGIPYTEPVGPVGEEIQAQEIPFSGIFSFTRRRRGGFATGGANRQLNINGKLSLLSLAFRLCWQAYVRRLHSADSTTCNQRFNGMEFTMEFTGSDTLRRLTCVL